MSRPPLPLRVCKEVAQRGDVKGLGRGRRRRRSWPVAVAPLVKRGIERVIEALVEARLQERCGGDIGEVYRRAFGTKGGS